MYKISINKAVNDHYFNTTLIANDKTHYINIYISEQEGEVFISITNSDDGFYFRSCNDTCEGLEVNAENTISEIYDYIRNYYLNNGYSNFTP